MQRRFFVRIFVVVAVGLVAVIAAAQHDKTDKRDSADIVVAPADAGSRPKRAATDCACTESIANPAIRTSQPQAGLRKKAQGNSRRGPPPETLEKVAEQRFRELSEWRGTEIRPAAEAEGAELELQEQIALAYFQRDPQPRQRLEEFAHYFSDPSLLVSGWYGAIQRVVEIPTGFRVDVRITPRLASTRHSVLVTGEFRIETWEYDGKNLVFLKTEGPPTSWKPMRAF
jgi:hypothetical protein